MLRLPRNLWPTSKELPDAVFVELIAILYTALLPIAFIGIASVGVGLLIAMKEGDGIVGALAIVAALVTIVRSVSISAYHRRAAKAPLTAAEARIWERRYAVGGLIFAVLLGILGLRAVLIGDPATSMLALGLIFGYGSGLVSRVAVRPTICFLSMILATAPAVAGFVVLLTTAGSAYVTASYAAQAILLAGFAFAGLESAVHGCRTTLQQLLTKQDLAALAGQDPLTGLPNRALLRARFNESAERTEQTAELLALHCLDLDHFKAVNDSFGHPVGDALLQAVATRLTRELQQGDTVARLGGDEFVVIQTGIRHAQEARLLGRRIIRAVSAPYDLDGRTVHIGVSIGIAIAPRDGRDLDRLSACADAALYQAKRAQRGSAVLWDDIAPPAAGTTAA